MSNTPLVVQVLELIRSQHGAPLPGASEQALRTAACKLVGTVAEVYAQRDIGHQEEAVWDRVRAMPFAKLNPTQKATS